ncbi:MAG: hypothetical protein HW390_2713 [Candidatus Brocadiaceae bacterium]|nr:hypothetical protein [Candidatus Brocadiaceae bacterium]
MRVAVILVSFIAVLLSLAWLIYKPAFDSAVAMAASLAALCSSFFLKREPKAVGQSQQVSGTSVGIQAGRDANVRDIKNH